VCVCVCEEECGNKGGGAAGGGLVWKKITVVSFPAPFWIKLFRDSKTLHVPEKGLKCVANQSINRQYRKINPIPEFKCESTESIHSFRLIERHLEERILPLPPGSQ